MGKLDVGSWHDNHKDVILDEVSQTVLFWFIFSPSGNRVVTEGRISEHFLELQKSQRKFPLNMHVMCPLTTSWIYMTNGGLLYSLSWENIFVFPSICKKDAWLGCLKGLFVGLRDRMTTLKKSSKELTLVFILDIVYYIFAVFPFCWKRSSVTHGATKGVSVWACGRVHLFLCVMRFGGRYTQRCSFIWGWMIVTACATDDLKSGALSFCSWIF